jgi:hypothetical protein
MKETTMPKAQTVPAPSPPAPAPAASHDAPTRRFRASQPVEYRKRGADDAASPETWWQPLGIALEYAGRDSKPPSVLVILNALPLPGPDGRVSFRLFLDDGRRRDRAAERSEGTPGEADDGIPF